MKTLRAFQHAFQHCLFNENDELDCVIGTKKVPAQTRLNIYINAYYARLIDALVSNYTVLQQWIGEEEFNHLAFKYIKQFPSTFRSIRWFGDQFAAFLEAENQAPSVIEMAKLEWTMAEVFDAKDRKTLSVKKMSVILPEAWPALRFKVHPTVRRLNLAWNVVGIWQAITDNQRVPTPVLNPQVIPWIFWRKELINHFYSLSPDEACAFDALLKGQSFAEICEELCAWIEEEQVGIRAATLLKGWIEAGLLANVNLPVT